MSHLLSSYKLPKNPNYKTLRVWKEATTRWDSVDLRFQACQFERRFESQGRRRHKAALYRGGYFANLFRLQWMYKAELHWDLHKPSRVCFVDKDELDERDAFDERGEPVIMYPIETENELVFVRRHISTLQTVPWKKLAVRIEQYGHYGAFLVALQRKANIWKPLAAAHIPSGQSEKFGLGVFRCEPTRSRVLSVISANEIELANYKEKRTEWRKLITQQNVALRPSQYPVP